MELPNNFATLIELMVKIPQQKIAQLISALLLVYIAYLAAQTTWMLAPSYDSSIPTQSADVINRSGDKLKSVNISDLQGLSLFGIYNALPVEKIVEIQDAPETRLNLILSAAVASDVMKAAAAIIEHKGSQETYGIGDMITGTRATLEQVLIDRVLIKQSGRMETLMLDGFDYKKLSAAQTKPIQRKTAGTIKQHAPKKPTKKNVVDLRRNRAFSQQAKNLKADISQDPGKITDYLKIAPKRVNGAIVGYRLMPGRQAEFYKTSGLKSGDIAVQMNGYDLTVPSEAAQALMALKQEQEISLLVQRKDGLTEILFSIDK